MKFVLIDDRYTCKVNSAKASGPEGWPILSLKGYAHQLSVLLSILFSKSFNSTSLPLAWKEALVTLIYKKGDRTAVSNYQPISLTSPLSKHCNQLLEVDMATNNLFTPNQLGFSSGNPVLVSYSLQ